MSPVEPAKEWTADFGEFTGSPDDYLYMPMVMAHEFGHVAGVGHSPGTGDVMGYPGDKPALSPTDEQALKELYRDHTAH